MSLVLDAKKVKLDSRNRIFVVASLAKYLGYIKDNKTGKDTKTDKDSRSETEYTIMFPKEQDVPGLILLNQELTAELYDEIRKTDSAKSRLTSLSVDKDDENQNILRSMRTGEIKTQKIQLYKSEVQQLKLDKTNMIVLDFTDVDKVGIYSEKYFKDTYPDRYQRFGLGDDEDG